MNNEPDPIEVEEISWEEFLSSGDTISEGDEFKPTEPIELDLPIYISKERS